MKVSFPHMGNYHIAFRSLFEKMGYDVIIPPAISKQTVELGSRHSPEFVCLPYKLNLGNFIEALEMGADILIQAGRQGSCRYGFYAEVQEQTLQDLGYNFRMISLFPNGRQLNFIASLKKIDSSLNNWTVISSAWLALAKVRLIDHLEHLTRKRRAYEVNPGETDSVLQRSLKLIDEVKDMAALKQVKRKVIAHFQMIERDELRRPVKIGIVGELYVVMEPYSNLDLEKKLGSLGAEVYRPLCLSEMLLHAVYKRARKRITREGRPFIYYELGAHAGHSVGHAVEFAREDFDGVIQLYPFTCMPELSARAVLNNVSHKLEIPILSISLGEHTGRAGLETRLEAFVDMLERRKKLGNHRAHRVYI